ncbi:unnamed protein product [Owenia fusiformis]|uniref:Uncharacterized protein n=1 Tax=Owenia fusiformis TaxID=6347 RepID=A0A8S4Q1P8_OWEFU|nr:unnamed protein product [Owenia fusiformis]
MDTSSCKVNVGTKPNKKDMRSQSFRLATYVNWPKDAHVRPNSLAEAGLYSTGSHDEVKCFSCDFTFSAIDDQALNEHEIKCPDCMFIKDRENSDNIPLQAPPDLGFEFVESVCNKPDFKLQEIDTSSILAEMASPAPESAPDMHLEGDLQIASMRESQCIKVTPIKHLLHKDYAEMLQFNDRSEVNSGKIQYYEGTSRPQGGASHYLGRIQSVDEASKLDGYSSLYSGGGQFDEEEYKLDDGHQTQIEEIQYGGVNKWHPDNQYSTQTDCQGERPQEYLFGQPIHKTDIGLSFSNPHVNIRRKLPESCRNMFQMKVFVLLIFAVFMFTYLMHIY